MSIKLLYHSPDVSWNRLLISISDEFETTLFVAKNGKCHKLDAFYGWVWFG